jgi:DMSO/TMAO reductase YedYZ heme-binding membrane subunit
MNKRNVIFLFLILLLTINIISAGADEIFNSFELDKITQGEKDNKKPFPAIIVYILGASILATSILPSEHTLKKAIRILSIYILPIVLIILSLLYPSRALYAEMGDWGEFLLLFLLFVKPIGVIFSVKIFANATRFRQEMGLATFYFFAVHSSGFIFLKDLGLQEITTTPYLIWGAIAAIPMTLLGLTSNRYSMMLLKQHWKTLHRLAYLAMFAALYHVAQVRNEFRVFNTLVVLFLIVKTIEFKGIRFLQPKEEVIQEETPEVISQKIKKPRTKKTQEKSIESADLKPTKIKKKRKAKDKIKKKKTVSATRKAKVKTVSKKKTTKKKATK